MKRTIGVALGICAFLLLAATSCTIGPGQSDSVTLRVPYRQQEQWDYCGAASVLMWRLYNGQSELPQNEIYTWMGGSGSGLYPDAIRDGASYYAGMSDAIVDRAAQDPVESQREFFARQISSIDSNTPVIAIVEVGFHAGVIDGGTWTRDAQTNLNVWNDVYFHDPRGFADRSYSSAQWMSHATGGYNSLTQIVSNSATFNWQSNYDAYGDSMVDSSGGGMGPEEQYAY